MMETVGAKPAKGYPEHPGRTHIEYTNPADVDFVVNTVEIYLISALDHTITVGAFSGSNPFTSQDSVNLGTVRGTDSYHSYTGLSIDFKSGERIGAHDSSELALARTPLGAGRNYVGNAFGAGAVTFSNTYPCCIYGSGEIAATVQTLSPSNITQSNFVANGSITSIGSGTIITKRGFCYKKK